MNAYEIFDGAYENAKMNGIETVDAQYFSDYAENSMEVILPGWIAEKMAAVYSEWMACDDKRDNNFWHIVEKPLTEIENNCPGAEMIKTERKSAGLTQEQAARVIGATRRAWQEWEAGRRNMPGAKWELFILKTKHMASSAERKRRIAEAVNEFFGDRRRVWATPGTDNHSANFYGDTWLCPLSKRDVVNLIDIAAIEWVWPGEDYPLDPSDVLTGKPATEAAIDAVLGDLQPEKPQE